MRAPASAYRQLLRALHGAAADGLPATGVVGLRAASSSVLWPAAFLAAAVRAGSGGLSDAFLALRQLPQQLSVLRASEEDTRQVLRQWTALQRYWCRRRPLTLEQQLAACEAAACPTQRPVPQPAAAACSTQARCCGPDEARSQPGLLHRRESALQQQLALAGAWSGRQPRGCRALSAAAAGGERGAGSSEPTGVIGAEPGEVAELLDASIYHPTKAEREAAREPGAVARRLLTTRREALALYREVLRYSNLFVWRDEHGRVWRDVLRASARAEFEAARSEADPELINRLIVTGRDAVQRTVEGFMRRRAAIIQDEADAPRTPPM